MPNTYLGEPRMPEYVNTSRHSHSNPVRPPFFIVKLRILKNNSESPFSNTNSKELKFNHNRLNDTTALGNNA